MIFGLSRPKISVPSIINHTSLISTVNRQLQILYLGGMKLRNLIVVTLVVFILLSFYLGRRSAQYTYNKMTNRFELVKEYMAQQRDIVMLGNSMIAHGDWTRQTGRCDIANLGIGGQTVADLQLRVDNVLAHRPKRCFIEAGINDIYRGVSYAQYISRLKELAEVLQSKGIRVTVFHILYTAPAFPGYAQINNQVTIYNRGVDSLATQLNFDVLNLNKQLSDNGHLAKEYAMDDGLHLNDAGYAIWGTELNKYLGLHK